MNNVLGFLEAKLMPLAAKTAQQRHLGAIRGAYVSFMPFIIVGSILLVISSFPNQAYQQFMSQAFGESWSAIIEIPFNAVFSTMSLFISFLVAFRLAEHYGEDRISCGILALVAFLILTPFIKVAENGGITVIPVEWIGSKGLFMAMIGSLLWTEPVLLAQAQKTGDQNAGRRASGGAGVVRSADPGPTGDDSGAGYPHRF